MIWRSPYPDVSIPDVPLHQLVLERAQQMGNKPAIVDGTSGATITYRELLQGVRSAAGALAERGLGRSDVLAIYSPNLPHYATLLYAVSSLSAISTTVNPLYTAGELAGQLRTTGARFLVTVPPLLDRAREAAEATDVEEIIVFGAADGATPFSSLLGWDGLPPPVDVVPREDVTVMPFSSGTTGVSKGVMLTHRNLVANLVQIDALGIGSSEDTLLGLLPFYHIYGMVCILHGTLYTGATMVTLPRFELEGFLDTLQRYRVTVAHLVPPIILALAKHPAVEGYDLSSLRLVVSGAAPLDADLIRAASGRVATPVAQGWGMTETSPVITCNVTGEPIGSVGPPLPNTECMVVDPVTGEALGPGESGELVARGPQNMKGYLNEPEATAMMIDEEGWLHSGDLGYATDDGNFYVVDRIKELIKYKGYQVAPAELEAVLLTHPLVADAAVIRCPDPEAGEVPKAFVVLKGEVSTEDVLSYVAELVAPHKKIRRIEVVDAIPRAPSGKILRRVLMEREAVAATS